MSRDDAADELARLQRENARLSDALAATERREHRLRCEYRRMCDEIDWRDEKIRVLQRVVERLAPSPD